MALVKTPSDKQFVQTMNIDAGRRAHLGNPEVFPAQPATTLTRLHNVMADAVKRADALEWDKTRTPAQQHHAGRKFAEATVAEMKRFSAVLKKWADDETAAGMAEVEETLEPEAGRSALMSELRSFLRSKSGDADFQAKLRGLVETDLRYAAAIGSAPAELSGLSSDRAAKLRIFAAAAHAPEASKRVAVAQEVAALNAKLAAVEAEVAASLYSAGIEAGMASAVYISAPLGGE